MRRIIVAFAVVALFAPVAATGDLTVGGKTPRTVLAIQTSKGGDVLVRLDGSSLEPVSRGLRLGGDAYAWSFSPDRRRLAIGVDRDHGFRIVDVRRLKSIGHVQTWSSAISSLAWLAPRRLVGIEPAGIFVADPVTRKLLPSPEVPGEIWCVERLGNRLVFLVAPYQQIGTARLAVLDPSGSLRTVELEGIRAGASPELGTGAPELRRPGLAVDPGGRAFVVGGGDEPIAEIAVDTLAVAYHRPERARSLLGRLHGGLEPAAEAKLPASGTFRMARWLGEGNLAVWGFDSARISPEQVETTPAGLSVVGTTTWTTRMIDSHAWSAAFAGGTLLASYQNGGLTAFAVDGQRRYHLFPGQALGVVATYGSRAFVAFDHKPMRVLDAVTGRVLGTRRSVPQLLDQNFSWWN